MNNLAAHENALLAQRVAAAEAKAAAAEPLKDQVWRDMGRCGEMREDVGRCGEM